MRRLSRRRGQLPSPEKHVEYALELADQAAPDGVYALYTYRRIAELVNERFGTKYAHRTIWGWVNDNMEEEV